MRSKVNSVGSIRVAITACAFALALSGCIGGTTYGTGVSQETQTLKDVYNMFTLKSERKNIDYSPRPDLIVPQNKQALVEPIENEATTSNTEWPETPEQRIARIRAQAGEVDPRTGEVSVAERLRKKEGIGIETQDLREKYIPGKTDQEGNPLPGTERSAAVREEVLKRKADLGVAPADTRRFLTDPPVAYREPAATAPVGIEAYSEEELAARVNAEKKLRAEQVKAMSEK
jgi:hypothetical protein